MLVEKQNYEDILLRIRDIEQLPSWYRAFYDSSKVAGMVLFYFSSVLFTTWWSYDLFEKTRLCKFESCEISNYLFEPGFEYALLAILFSSMFYFLYRSTDWPYVKEKALIVIILSLLVVSLSGGGALWLKAAHDPITDELYNIKDTIKLSLPWRSGLITGQNTNSLKPISGIVEESTKDTLILAIPLRRKVNLFYEQKFQDSLKPKIGSRVVVKMKLLNNSLYVQSIEDL
jgi:hypothetical protein